MGTCRVMAQPADVTFETEEAPAAAREPATAKRPSADGAAPAAKRERRRRASSIGATPATGRPASKAPGAPEANGPAPATPAGGRQAARIASLEAELARVGRERDELRRRADAAESRADAGSSRAALARAREERDEAYAQRDEVLLALRALERRVRSELAREDRSRDGDGDGARARTAGPDEPLGVRRIPAARAVMAELLPPAPRQRIGLSRFDLWIMRVLGTVAGGCFILLLVSLLRVAG